ncbi:uncharacterized protein LOC124939531 [Impatiens glandulifera]|uniref:uncharacterized protein LOC124939531 n=1 Tax=Impatiens glandulifera TaxID=253017 RepID=UPI001FB10598|nr:uncharacterized protein LOC124939531 [Impatiens glandulifera]
MAEAKEVKYEKETRMTDVAHEINVKCGIQIKEALQLQLDIQRRLYEQLEVQRKLQLQIEEQGKQLKIMHISLSLFSFFHLRRSISGDSISGDVAVHLSVSVSSDQNELHILTHFNSSFRLQSVSEASGLSLHAKAYVLIFVYCQFQVNRCFEFVKGS